MFVGIVAEYNPFHNGHAAQLAAARAAGADCIAVAMSAGAVQRGEVPILPESVRVRAALASGADLIAALPAPYACAGAEAFAAAGVRLLAALGCDTLAFGAETPDAARLMDAARLLLSEKINAELRKNLDAGQTFAAARAAAAETACPGMGALLREPNNILGVEYCKAIARQTAALMPLALPRRGVGHDGGAAEGFASASRIRELLINGACADEFLTPESADIYARECAAGRAPVTMANAERAILARLRAMREEDLAPFDGGGEGLYHRFYDAVQRETTIDGILAAAKSKRYAYARLRRLLLAVYLGVTPEDIPQRVPYLRVLACNERGREVLKTMKTTAAAPILTKSAQVRRLDADAQRLFALTARAEEQYVLAYPDLAAARPGSAWTTTPVIL